MSIDSGKCMAAEVLSNICQDCQTWERKDHPHLDCHFCQKKGHIMAACCKKNSETHPMNSTHDKAELFVQRQA